MADRPKIRPEQKWLTAIAAYDKEFKPWAGRVDKLIQRYRDESTASTRRSQTKFNILWSNVQTLVPACFSRLPQPDVSRRFRDQDAVGRVASLILERVLDYEITHYPDYRVTLTQDVYDRFLGGRGTAWVRYEPHFKAQQQQAPTDGVQASEDQDEPGEELDYECAPVDYVHWKDFGHTVARTWEEVTAVWRVVYMTEQQLVERFGEKVAKKVPLDAKPGDKKNEDENPANRGVVYEIWDKPTKKVYWLAKSLSEFIDERDDPLGLDQFFPCPRPLYATITNDSLVPVPDFALYQDQANELDTLAGRINGLVKSLQLKGVYDATQPELGRLFTEANNTQMIPVKNWAAFAEKQGLAGAIDLVEILPIAETLKVAYEAMGQVKSQVYEITGISDIIRGQTDAGETATAQQIKGQYASLRLRSMQGAVSQFAAELLQLKAQVICNKFDPMVVAQLACVQQLNPADQQYIGPAMELLFGARLQDPAAEPDKNPLRDFRIDIEADSLVQLDEQAEKESRVEFLTAVGGFLEKAATVGAQAPQVVPLIMELLKFGVTGFKVGRSIEGVFDQVADQLKQAPPQQDPEQMRQQIEGQVKQQVQMDQAGKDVALNKRAADLDIREMKFQAEQQIAAERARANQVARDYETKRQQDDAVREVEKLIGQHEAGLSGESEKDAQINQRALELDMREMKAQADTSAFDAETKRMQVIGSLISSLVQQAAKQEEPEGMGEKVKQSVEGASAGVQQFVSQLLSLLQNVQGVSEQMSGTLKQIASQGDLSDITEALQSIASFQRAPKRVVRGNDGTIEVTEA